MSVFAAQQMAEGRYDTLLHQVGDLRLIAGNGEIGDGPSGFLLSLKFTLCSKECYVIRPNHYGINILLPVKFYRLTLGIEIGRFLTLDRC